LAENKLFATLDPSSRRLRFPRDIEVIITDTVGFIRDLPKELMAAFKATLEELENADLLLHVIDISNPRHPEQIRSVETILAELNLSDIPTIRVLNKIDQVGPEDRECLVRRLDGIAVSALKRPTLRPLTEKMAVAVENLSSINC
jgi:GTP-binding protein HflX